MCCWMFPCLCGIWFWCVLSTMTLHLYVVSPFWHHNWVFLVNLDITLYCVKSIGTSPLVFCLHCDITITLQLHLPQYLPRYQVISLLHVDRLGKLPGPFQGPCKGEKLVFCSTTRTKSALFRFNSRLDYWLAPSFLHLRVNFPREAE